MAHEHRGGILLRIVLSAAALYLTAQIVSGITFTGGVVQILLAGLLLGVLNAVVKPILVFFSIPLLILSLGLFYFIINAVILLILGAIMPTLGVAGLGAALIGSIVLSLVNLVLHAVFNA